jgi:signal transduction histidine kinase
MTVRAALRTPYAVPAVFFAVAIVSTTALGWLVLEQYRQDAIVEAQRQRAAVAQTAERTVANMHRTLFELEALVRAGDIASAAVARGLSVLSMATDAVAVRPEGSLPFVPVRDRAVREAPTSAFAAADRLEFADGGRDQEGALRLCLDLARSSDTAIRAAALTRVARIHRRLGHPDAALRAYAELATIDGVSVDGLPPALVASVARIGIHERAHDIGAMRRETEALRRNLASGAWSLLQSEYEFYFGEVTRHLGAPAVEDLDARARAEAAGWLWQQRASLPPVSRRAVPVSHGPAFAMWSTSPGELRAVVGGPAYLGSLVAETVPAGFVATLTHPDGANLFGPDVPDGAVEVRAASSGLPWSLHVARGTGALSAGGGRRLLLLLVFGTVALVTVTGGALILRSIRRELRVARMQADFVTAVSHEFRTPLSSMYQIAQMLEGDRFATAEARRTSYEVLVRETERLRQLVEGLLDFGRFERADAFRFERLDVAVLVRSTVRDFANRAAQDGYVVELACECVEAFVRADRDALVRALWNLLDNAVKYSPDCRTVWVEVVADRNDVRITVRDQGLGIPMEEQQQVFDRFVRGATSKARRIKGTGIGLAMVRQIVHAHGGEIRVQSEPGRGSCFTMELHATGGPA